MEFTIETINSSGMKYSTKEEFLSKLSMMIDDCIANGGTFFDAKIDSDDGKAMIHSLFVRK